MLQSIQSQMTRMNDLFKRTSEDPDAKALALAVASMQRLETHLDSDERAFFFDLFSLNSGVVTMYNSLVDGSKEDWHAFLRQKLKDLKKY